VSELGFVHQFIRGNSQRTLLLLHGTGGDEHDLIELGRAIDPDAALLSPRGKVLENGAPRFFRRLAEGVFDEKDLIARAHELAEFIDNAATAYKFDINDLVAVGYSNGANIAAAILLLALAKFHYAILFRAMVPLSNIELPNLSAVRALICAGQFDPIIPMANPQRLAKLLENSGAEVSLQVQPSGHELSAADLVAAQTWLLRGDKLGKGSGQSARPY
jgi:predicted esterase